LTQAKCF